MSGDLVSVKITIYDQMQDVSFQSNRFTDLGKSYKILIEVIEGRERRLLENVWAREKNNWKRFLK